MGSTDTPRDYATRALVVQKAGDPFTMTDITLDEVRNDELLIEMKYSGICHTDIVLASGALPLIDFPAIFGHEGAGTILAIGSGVQDKSLQVGDAVLLSFNTCGECYQCREGSPAYCHLHPHVNHNAVRFSDRSTPARLSDNTSVRSQYFGHSSFAAHSVVKERCVVKLPSDLTSSMPYYAALGCGFQTGAGTVLNVLKPKPDDSVVVFGLGGVGLTAVMAARSLGVKKIVGVDIQPGKLALANDFGETDAVDAGKTDDVVAKVKEICKTEARGPGATFSIDCTGVPRVIEQCIEVLAPCGTAATVGVPPPGEKGQIKIDALTFLLENKRYIGVIEGMSTPKEFIPKLVEMHQKGEFPVEKLCKVYGIDDYKTALHELEEGKVIKPVIQWK